MGDLDWELEKKFVGRFHDEGKEVYREFKEYLAKTGVNLNGFYGLDVDRKVGIVSDYCEESGLAFKEIYPLVEDAHKELMREEIISGAIVKIMTRDGHVPPGSPEQKRAITKRLEEIDI